MSFSLSNTGDSFGIVSASSKNAEGGRPKRCRTDDGPNPKARAQRARSRSDAGASDRAEGPGARLLLLLLFLVFLLVLRKVSPEGVPGRCPQITFPCRALP